MPSQSEKEIERRIAKRLRKPPYHVPTRDELPESNGYNVVSLFAGCGGTGYGFEMAGFKVVWANEFVPRAAADHEANFPDAMLNTADIRKLDREFDVILDGWGEVDVLEGSPPCASFSAVGKRDKHWGEARKYSDTTQRTDDLFMEYVRAVERLRPRVFVAENVPGLAQGRSVGVLREVITAMQALGYKVENRYLDAQWLGVPQRRERLWFFGVRDDLNIGPTWPLPLTHRYSILDAFHDLPPHPVPKAAWIRDQAIGAEWAKLPLGQWSERYMNLMRVPLDQPCPAVTQRGGGGGVASVTHPREPRKFTIPELRRICGFPDDFVLSGTYAQQYERLGRAVPPPVARAVASEVFGILERRPRERRGRKSLHD